MAGRIEPCPFAATNSSQTKVQAFAAGFAQNQFFQLRYQQGGGDWTYFEKEVRLPEWTAFFNVGLLVEGEGSAWLDEVHEAGSPVDVGNPEDVFTSGPPKDKPSVPGWGFWPDHPAAWMNMHRSFLQRTAEDREKGGIRLVFLGDSITQGWSADGKDIWESRYAPCGAVNYGIGGDSTRQVLWRIGHGELDGLHPRGVVLMIGTNNLYGDGNAGSDEEVAAGVGAIVGEVRRRLPETKILLLGLLPRQNAYFSGRIQRINALLARLDDGDAVHFPDIGAEFQAHPGQGDVFRELYHQDQLHLVKKGYEVWAEAMQPAFDALLK